MIVVLKAGIDKAKQEYSVEQHIGEEVIADIANWIRAQR